MKFYQRVAQGWLALESLEQIVISVVLVIVFGNMLTSIVQPDVFPFIGGLSLFVMAGFILVVLCLTALPIEID